MESQTEHNLLVLFEVFAEINIETAHEFRIGGLMLYMVKN